MSVNSIMCTVSHFGEKFNTLAFIVIFITNKNINDIKQIIAYGIILNTPWY